jgi:ATP:corrinoid adenosyltransferase
MTEQVAFLIKDLVLFAVSFCLLKQDLVRTLTSVKQPDGSVITGNKTPHELAVSKLSELS